MNYERQSETIEVSVVIPCLNEQETLGQCIEKAARALEENQIEGEIIMADNGSTDSSRTIAENCGARVVLVNEPGYGNALMGGIAAARGRFVIIDDADAGYDFVEIPKFVEKLRAGFIPRLSNRLLQFFRQHSRDAPEVTEKSKLRKNRRAC